MIAPITFFAAGLPKGQPRARAFAMKGKGVRMYDPGTAEGWKGSIAGSCRELIPETPIDEPLTLTLTFYMPRPKSHYHTGKRSSERRNSAPYWYASKPDADNLAKAVMDAMTVLGFWKDDDQIVQLRVKKMYACPGMEGCHIEITESY